MADGGSIQENEPCGFEGEEDFRGDRVAELKRLAEAPGYGRRGNNASEITHQAGRPPSIDSSKPVPPSETARR